MTRPAPIRRAYFICPDGRRTAHPPKLPSWKARHATSSRCPGPTTRAAERSRTREGHGRRGTRRNGATTNTSTATTGEVFDLARWAIEHAHKFQIVEALRARRPDLFVGKIAEGIKHHIRCVNADEHTHPGPDAATFVVNASESSSQRIRVPLPARDTATAATACSSCARCWKRAGSNGGPDRRAIPVEPGRLEPGPRGADRARRRHRVRGAA